MAAGNIKGITIEIGGDTTTLDKALKGVNQTTKTLKDQLKSVNQALKLDPTNTELLAQKQEILSRSIENTKEKLQTLKTAQEQADAAFARGEIDENKYRALQTEITNTESELKKLENEAKSFRPTFEAVGKTVQDVGDKFKKAGEGMQSAGKALMPVTAAISGVGAASIAAAMDLDNGYDTIITKTGAVGDALDGLKAQMDRVFEDIPTNAETAGIAIGEVNTRFGLTGDELGDLSKQFIEFAEINGTDLNHSIDSVDAIMTKFDVDISETGKVLGLMTQAGQDTGLSMDDLYRALETNGATLKEMGLGLEESVNLLAQFEASGVDSATALAALKKAQQNATAEGKTLDQALNEQIDAIREASSETEALQIATELFGKKGAAEMTQAIREGRFSVDDLSASLDDYASTVEDTYNATLDPWDQLTVATNSLKVSGAELAGTILNMLQPAINAAVGKVKSFTAWFKNLNDSQKQMIVRIGAIIAAIAPALLIGGKIISGVGKLTSGIGGMITKAGGLISKIGGLRGALSAITSPFGAVIAAIAALAAGFVYLYKTNDEFRKKVNAAVEKVKKAFQDLAAKIKPILEKIKEAFQKLMRALQPVFEFIMTGILAVVNGIIDAAAPIISAITNVVDFVTNIVSAVLAFLHGDFDGFFGYISGALQNVVDFIKNIVSGIVNFIVGFFEGFGIDIKKIFTDIWNGIVSIFQGVGQWFSDRFTEAYTNITNVFQGIGQWFGERWSDIKNIFSAVGTWFSDKFTEAYTNIKNVFEDVITFFAGIWEKIQGIFVDAGTSIANKISGVLQSEVNNAIGAVQNALNGLTNGALNAVGVGTGKAGNVSLPQMAKGGTLKEGQAIVAEAGPELIRIVNGKAVVTPLTKGAKNSALDGVGKSLPLDILYDRAESHIEEAIERAAAAVQSMNTVGHGGDYIQNINIESPAPLSAYEVARQTRNQTRNMVLRLQRG